MVPENIYIADTGFIVAFVFQKERHHPWTVEVMNRIPAPLLICEAVLSETLFFAQKLPRCCEKVLELIEDGAFKIDFDLSKEQNDVFELIKKYENLPMSLADACLVRMAEMNPRAVIVTFDKHFEVYRKNRRHKISILMPPHLP